MKNKLKPGEVPPRTLSSGARLSFTCTKSTPMTPYTFHLDGVSYGDKFGISMTREGLRHLILEMVKAL